MLSRRLLLNFPLGLFLGCSLTLLLAYFLDRSFSDQLSKFYTFVFSALLSLVAATLALAGALNASNTQQKIDENNRLRRLASAKASLPSTLSSALDYYNRLQEWNAPGLNEEPPEAIETGLGLEPQSVNAFKAVIENASPEEAHYFSRFLAHDQILTARCKDRINLEVAQPSQQTMELSVDIARQQTALNFAFDYARGRDSIDRKISPKDLYSIASCHQHGNDEPLMELARLYSNYWHR